MDKKPKKPSTYDMLKRLDKKVQQNKTQRKDDSNSRYSNDSKRRRSESPRDSRKRRSRSGSPRRQDRRPKKVEEIFVDDTDYDIPDRSFGDLYCKACDSHMNSDQMWEAHIQGKRHQKHIKKGGDSGEKPKYEILNEDPLILSDIKKSTEPIIGLQHCCEIRRLEGKPIYQCFLCSANVPNGQLLLEHVVGLKHRMAYLKEHDPVKHDLIDKTNLKKGMIEPVVAECIRLHQDKHGTGIMQVKLDKTKISAPLNQSNRKPSQDNFDNNLKREDRRSTYQSERDEDFRYDRQPRDCPRPGFSEDPYLDRYPYPSDDIRDRGYLEPSTRYPRRESPPMDRGPPMERRSPLHFERGYYGQPSIPNKPSSHPVWATEPSQKTEEFRRREEGSNSNLNLFQQLLNIMETMPNMMFLEIVLHKVENMDPTEDELAVLQKIGNHLISIVMNRKLQKLSPDILGKYQENSKPQPIEEQNKSTNNLSSLMNLVSQFNSTKAASSASPFDWGNQNSSAEKTSANNPAFMTQTSGSFYNASSWSSSSTTEIPGLTLSSSSEDVTYPQRSFNSEVARAPSWSDLSIRNNYSGF